MPKLKEGAEYINVKISARSHRIFRAVASARGLGFAALMDEVAEPYARLVRPLQDEGVGKAGARTTGGEG